MGKSALFHEIIDGCHHLGTGLVKGNKDFIPHFNPLVDIVHDFTPGNLESCVLSDRRRGIVAEGRLRIDEQIDGEGVKK